MAGVNFLRRIAKFVYGLGGSAELLGSWRSSVNAFDEETLSEKRSVPASAVEAFERMVEISNLTVGHLLFCLYACARWGDSMTLQSLKVSKSGDVVLLEADALRSKPPCQPGPKLAWSSFLRTVREPNSLTSRCPQRRPHAGLESCFCLLACPRISFMSLGLTA